MIQKIILFVCTENSARSQIAEAFFNHLNKNHNYIGMSAGTNPSKEINPLALGVMKESKIDTFAHKPKLLEENVVQKAYKIITMGCIKGCPITPREKTIEWNVDDPAGKPIEEFRKARNDIEVKIKELLKELSHHE